MTCHFYLRTHTNICTYEVERLWIHLNTCIPLESWTGGPPSFFFPFLTSVSKQVHCLSPHTPTPLINSGHLGEGRVPAGCAGPATISKATFYNPEKFREPQLLFPKTKLLHRFNKYFIWRPSVTSQVVHSLHCFREGTHGDMAKRLEWDVGRAKLKCFAQGIAEVWPLL